MQCRRKLSPGDMICLHEGGYAILLERFDIYADANIAAPRPPSWAWRINFSVDPNEWRRNYSPRYGWSEMNIINRAYGEVVIAEGKK